MKNGVDLDDRLVLFVIDGIWKFFDHNPANLVESKWIELGIDCGQLD